MTKEKSNYDKNIKPLLTPISAEPSLIASVWKLTINGAVQSRKKITKFLTKNNFQGY